MKKIFTLCSCAFALSISAAPVSVMHHASAKQGEAIATPETISTNDIPDFPSFTVSTDESAGGKFKAPGRGPVGYNTTFVYHHYESSSSRRGYHDDSMVQLEWQNDTEVLIYGLGSPSTDAPLKAIYNPSSQTLSIASPQEIVSAEEWNGEPLMFYAVDFGKNNSWTELIPSVELKFLPDGIEEDGNITCKGGWIVLDPNVILSFNIPSYFNDGNTTGWSWKQGNRLRPIEEVNPRTPTFYFDPSRGNGVDFWKYLGKAKVIQDGWFGGEILGDGQKFFGTYDNEVDVYQGCWMTNGAGDYWFGPKSPEFNNSRYVLLRNPYSEFTPLSEYNPHPAGGLIVLDLFSAYSFPIVVPHISTGLKFKTLSDGPIFFTNDGGIKYYIEGLTDVQVADYYEEMLSEYGGSYNDLVDYTHYEVWNGIYKTIINRITLPDCKFQKLRDFNGYDWWVKRDEAGNKTPLPMKTIIDFSGLELSYVNPANTYPSDWSDVVYYTNGKYEESSVKGIDAETNMDKTPRYFNLQGMEIAHPQPGQVIIIKIGNKSRKIIF